MCRFAKNKNEDTWMEIIAAPFEPFCSPVALQVEFDDEVELGPPRYGDMATRIGGA